MKASEIHAMSVDQIQEELETARENLFNLRFQWATAQIRDHNLLKAARRDIARLETILRARQLEAQGE
jgi:large subunit ribosomal protein L29